MVRAERSRWGWKRKLALQLVLLPVLALAVEGGFRLWLGLNGRAYDGAEVQTELIEIVSSMRDTIPDAPDEGKLAAEARALEEQTNNAEPIILHPYFGWERIQSVAVLEDQVLRFDRGEYDDSYNVLIVGGSVSGIFGRKGSERLGELMALDARFAGREIRFFGHGRGSFKQPQQAHLVQFLISMGYRLDCVINIDGFNELALGNKNAWDGAHPLYPNAIRYAHLAQGGDADPGDLDLLLDVRAALREATQVTEQAIRSGTLRSAVFGRRAKAKVHAARRRFGAAQAAYGARLAARDSDAAVRGPTFSKELEDVLTLIVENWVESSINLQAICDARGITYLHVLQPTMHDEGSKVLTEIEISKDNAHQSWIEAIKPGYPMLREAGWRLLAAGVNFLDGSMLFRDEPDTMYFDACHFRTHGNVLFADQIAPALLAALPDRLPIRRP